MHIYLRMMRNIISVTGDADDAALKSLRGDWKTYSRLRGITIEVSRRVTHRGSWKWCCLNVRGRSCKSLDETRLSSIISISAIIQRSPRFRAHLTHARLPYSLLEMRSTSTSLSTSVGVVHVNACCSPGTDQSRKYARLPLRVSRTAYVLFIHLR